MIERLKKALREYQSRKARRTKVRQMVERLLLAGVIRKV